MTTLNSNDEPKVVKQYEKKDRAPFFRKLATASWVLPIISVFWIKTNMHVSQKASMEQGMVLLVVAIVLVLGGLMCAILAIVNAKKYGSIGIKKPAVIGLLLSLIYLGSIGYGAYTGIAKRQKKQDEIYKQIKKESQTKVKELMASLDEKQNNASKDKTIIEIKNLVNEIGAIYQKYLSEDEFNWLGEVANKYNGSIDWESADAKKMNALSKKIEKSASAKEKKTIDRYNELILQQIKK